MSDMPDTKPSAKKHARLTWALVVVVALVCLVSAVVFLTVRFNSFRTRLAAHKAQLGMQQAVIFHATTGRWPTSPSELVPAYMQSAAASKMQSEGYVFDVTPDGEFYIRWQYRGIPQSMDVVGKVEPPLP